MRVAQDLKLALDGPLDPGPGPRAAFRPFAFFVCKCRVSLDDQAILTETESIRGRRALGNHANPNRGCWPKRSSL